MSLHGLSRYRLRLRVFLAVVGGALLPLLVVTLWSQIERPVPNTIASASIDSVDETRAVLSKVQTIDEARAAIVRIAEGRGAHIRIFDDKSTLLLNVDHDANLDRLHPIERFFFGALTDKEAQELASKRGDILERHETRLALEGRATTRSRGISYNCNVDDVIACGAATKAKLGTTELLLHVEKTSVRAVAAVYALRRQLTRLAYITIPVTILLAWYVSSRLMRPIEKLRKGALSKANSQNAKADLLEDVDEVGEVSQAVNHLLASLATQRKEHGAALSDLVHELKSPISAVRSVSDLLISEGKRDARNERLSGILGDASKKMDAVVSQYLDLARVEAGLPGEVRTRVSVQSLIDAASASLLRPIASRVDPGAGSSIVECVEGRIVSAIRELLENAASFTDESKIVRLEACLEGDKVAIAIVDEGPGIPDASLARVFDRFFTTRGDKRGTGLGLAMVRATAQAHGGSATAFSKEGHGAVFRLTLPLATR